jgi:dCTP deaminase
VSILTGSQIAVEYHRGNIVIDPWDQENLGANSYNLKLANRLYYFTPDMLLDMKSHTDPLGPIIIGPEGYILRPNHLYLGKTEEYTETHGFVPVIDGRSSIGRLGVTTHVTAGFGDIGFKGNWTLEITVTVPVKVYSSVEFCQIRYHTIYGEIRKIYQGKYQGNRNITPSLLHEEIRRNEAARPPQKDPCC